MSIFDDLAFFVGSRISIGSSPTARFGIHINDTEAKLEQDGEKTSISTVYTCQKKLSENISRLPIKVTKEGKFEKDHKLNKRLYRPNGYQNRQVFWSTIEILTNNYGNAFVDLRKDNWELIHPKYLDDYEIKNGVLRYHFDYTLKSDSDILTGKLTRPSNGKEKEWVESKDLLHFKGVSTNGIIGLSPIAAFLLNLTIQTKAANTIIQFYKNRAVSPMAVASEIQNTAAYNKMKEAMEDFEDQYQGSQNWGKPIVLPPNTKLLPMAMQFADAQLIETLKFTRDEIAALYGVPQFMFNDTVTQQREIEQQTLFFKVFTIAPKVAMYESELNFKLLDFKEEIDGVEISFDMDIMVEADLKTKIDAYTVAITKGLMTPNEAARKFGSTIVNNPLYDEKFLQQQYWPISWMKQDDQKTTGDVDNKSSDNKPDEKAGKENNKE